MAKFCFCVFFSGSWLRGEKKHKRNPPQVLGQSRENFVYVFFSLCVLLFAPKMVLRITVFTIYSQNVKLHAKLLGNLSLARVLFTDGETTTKIKFAALRWRGALIGGSEDNPPKCCFSWEAPQQ